MPQVGVRAPDTYPVAEAMSDGNDGPKKGHRYPQPIPHIREGEKPSQAETKDMSPEDSVLGRDPKFLVLIQPPDHDAAVLRHKAHELLRDVLDLIVGLQLLDAGAGSSVLAFTASGCQL